jgi:hypothetical protein
MESFEQVSQTLCNKSQSYLSKDTSVWERGIVFLIFEKLQKIRLQEDLTLCLIHIRQTR